MKIQKTYHTILYRLIGLALLPWIATACIYDDRVVW